MDAVLNWLWQGGVVAAAAFVMLAALARARANVRYTVCWAAALIVMVLPVIASLQTTPASADAFSAQAGAAIVSLPSAWWTSALAILVAWTVWAGVQGVRFVSAIAAIRRARARSRAFPSDVELRLPRWRRVRSQGRRARLVLSDSVTTAAVLSWGSPIIAVAPALVHTLDADDLDRILIHEWAHVQRRDDLVNILQIAVRIFAGWHPAVRLLERRLQIEREIACDEMAVAITGSPKSYAQCLMKLAVSRSAPRGMRMAPAILMTSGLRARVVKILSPQRAIAPVWSRSLAAAAIAALCVMSAGVGGLKIVEAAAIAVPFVSPRTLGTTLALVQGAPRVATASSSSDAGTTKAPAAPPRPADRAPQTAPAAPSTGDAARAVESIRIAETDALLPGVAAEVPAPPQAAPARSDATSEQPNTPSAARPQSPWNAAAAGGTAIGKKSKDAGVATAGFFSRIARRVAGSF